MNPDLYKILISFHGTFITLDETGTHICHVPIGKFPTKIFLHNFGGQSEFCVESSGKFQPIGYFDPEDGKISADYKGTLFSVIEVHSGLFNLIDGGRYLCADEGEKVTCRRQVASAWETFLPITQDNFARLEFIMANRWLTLAPPLDRPWHKPKLQNSFELQIGDMRVHLTEMLQPNLQSDFGSTRPWAAPLQLEVFSEKWKINYYALFRPLAYFVAYGKDEIFACAELAICSLFEYGKWPGDVIVITDCNQKDFLNRFPVEFQDRISIKAIPGYDTLDYTLNRYKIIDIPDADLYQPIIYIDVDVICDNSLEKLVLSTMNSDRIEVFIEHYLISHPENYFGISLLEEDKIQVPCHAHGISSGIILFKNTHTARRIFLPPRCLGWVDRAKPLPG